MTNKEWLMTLPSIEMARIMYDFGDCSNCPFALSCSDQDTTCNEKMAEWLDKEYKGKDKEQLPRINGYCKDCQYYNNENFYCNLYDLSYGGVIDRGETDYCSDFEPKEDKC